MQEMSMRVGAILSTFGIVIIAVGSIAPKYMTVRLAGLIISAGGLVVMGRRIYDRVRKRMAQNNKARN